MADYYSILSDPSHAWMNDPDSPFEIPPNYRDKPLLQCDYRTFKRGSRNRLKTPVVEKPLLVVFRSAHNIERIHPEQVASSSPKKLTPKERFNRQMEQLVKRWHVEAQRFSFDQLKPWIRFRDDSLSGFFS